MLSPSWIERLFRFHTTEFTDAVQGRRYAEAARIRHEHGLVEAVAGRAAEEAFHRCLAEARFRDAVEMNEHLQLKPGWRPDRGALCTEYRTAIARRDYRTAKQCVCDGLDIIRFPAQKDILGLLLDAAVCAIEAGVPVRSLPYVPGHPRFKCIPDVCGAQCCRSGAFAVRATGQDVFLIEERAKMPQAQFCQPGEGGLMEVKMNRDSGGHRCIFLSAGNRCSINDAKPDGCAQYPFCVGIFVRGAGGKLYLPRDPHVPSGEAARTALDRFVSCSIDVDFFLLLGADRQCPGLGGDPISMDEYLSLARQQLAFCLCKDRGLETCSRHKKCPPSRVSRLPY